jgi:hypothetical protein
VLEVVARRAGSDAPTGARAASPTPWRDLAASMVAARVAVLLALGVALLVRHTLLLTQHVAIRGDTLLGWDAAWYLRLAEHGYAGTVAEGSRFFPAFPLMIRAASVPLLGHRGVAALLIANCTAVGYVVLLHRLALAEGLGEEAARRVVWLTAFVPAGFVLVMGYSEPVFGVEITGCLLAVRRRRWLPAAGLGALAGLTRPTGVVIAVFVLVEAARHVRGLPVRDVAARLLAVVAPLTGLAAYLAWAAARFGDALRPLRVQTAPGLRGGILVNPFSELGRVVHEATTGVRIIPAVHLPWIVLAFALLVVVARRLPASHAAYASVCVLLGVTAQDFSSFERYAGSCVPLLLAAASLRVRTEARAAVLAAAAGLMFGLAVLAFLHLYVP